MKRHYHSMGENKPTVTIHTTVRPSKSLQVVSFNESKSRSLARVSSEENFLTDVFIYLNRDLLRDVVENYQRKHRLYPSLIKNSRIKTIQ